jgi:hypothetical protein
MKSSVVTRTRGGSAAPKAKRAPSGELPIVRTASLDTGVVELDMRRPEVVSGRR